MLHSFNLILAGAGMVAVTGSILLELNAVDIFAITFAGFIIAATAAPYALLAALSRQVDSDVARIVCGLGLAALSAFWIWAFGAVFWWNPTPDAQDGLALIVFPALMIAGAGAVAIIAWLIARFA
ncbi:hypothetical protein EDC22_10452 [Tepidamorphus gemmatus]|uniref:Uncharacterized protein n=1 Tax=Tepidamorphus gemmatus TaxID=747076 RepID=A0A4R3MHZ4_9HYPH|nr:hypothetical protein [Tepidamorphus gemmatus]TCT11295.1 hypothetical protein EDC22_10452 [Tepidamorphus gemmatus]